MKEENHFLQCLVKKQLQVKNQKDNIKVVWIRSWS
jgi:hypothetical protein